jgi:hypothetical protein
MKGRGLPLGKTTAKARTAPEEMCVIAGNVFACPLPHASRLIPFFFLLFEIFRLHSTSRRESLVCSLLVCFSTSLRDQCQCGVKENQSTAIALKRNGGVGGREMFERTFLWLVGLQCILEFCCSTSGSFAERGQGMHIAGYSTCALTPSPLLPLPLLTLG